MSGDVHERGRPAYPLDDVHDAFGADRFRVSRRVLRHLDHRGWKRETVRACICMLRAADFYKSQAHRTEPGVWLDIYKPFLDGERMYVKFAVQRGGGSYVVLSFCGDGEKH